jgi:hypothetical protein
MVSGRTYSSQPGSAINIPFFDAPLLAANGWKAYAGSLLPTTTSGYSSGEMRGVVTNPNGSPVGIAVRAYIDGSSAPAGVTVADANGDWSIPIGSLSSGSHAFSVEIDTSAGSFVVGLLSGIMDFGSAGNSGLLAAIAA